MRVIYKPERKPRPPRPPRWWKSLGLPEGTLVENDGVQWVRVLRQPGDETYFEWHMVEA